MSLTLFFNDSLCFRKAFFSLRIRSSLIISTPDLISVWVVLIFFSNFLFFSSLSYFFVCCLLFDFIFFFISLTSCISFFSIVSLTGFIPSLILDWILLIFLISGFNASFIFVPIEYEPFFVKKV